MGAGCSRRKDVGKAIVNSLVPIPATQRTDETTNLSSSSICRKYTKRPKAVIDSRLLPVYRRASVCERPKTQNEIDKITHALQRHSALSDLPEETREEVLNNMKLCVFPAGQAVVHEGEVATHFYVVVQGALEVRAEGRRLNILKPGDSFGEQALLLNSVRSATVCTLDSCVLWGLERSVFLQAVEVVSSQRYEENRAFLTGVPLLSQLTLRQQERLLGIAVQLTFAPKRKIVSEGEQGALLFVIKSGSAVCSVNGQTVRRLQPGDYFGEQALLQDGVRTATVTAEEPVHAIVISREALVQVLGDTLEKVVSRNTQRHALEACHLLNQLPEACKERLINLMHVSCFSSGMQVAEKLQDEAFVVLKGELSDGTVRLGIVGVEEMLSDTMKTVDLRATSDSLLATFTRSALEKAAECSVQQVRIQSEALRFFKQVSLFHGLTLPQSHLLQLYSALKQRRFEAGAVIFQEGDQADSLFLVQSGTVQISKGGLLLRTVGRYALFGERSVLLGQPRSASATAENSVHCLELRREQFLQVLDEKTAALLAERIRLQDDSVTLDQLTLVKELGHGRFSHVFLMAHKSSSALYVLKSISRTVAESSGLWQRLQAERHLRLQLDHVFAAKLVRTFKDTSRVYFLSEFVQGQDLYEVLRLLGVLKDEAGRFYAAALSLVLEHLHFTGVLYRDLKPEKVLVDQSGYPKLVDFGAAKQVQGRTFTVLGTPHYVAPEVLQGQGYGEAADLWSLGVLIYELLCGDVPFGSDQEDPLQVYESVLHRPLQFPVLQKKNSLARSFLDALLQKNPAFRPSASQLKQHGWLAELDWECLQLKQLVPPFLPRLRSLDAEVRSARMEARDLQVKLDLQDLANLEDPAPAPQHFGWDDCF